MKASWAGLEPEPEEAWLDWMARYTEYSTIFPEVTAGGSQVSWAPSRFYRTRTKDLNRSTETSSCHQ